MLWLALSLNAGLLVVQLVGGIAFGSLALLADSAHLATDVLGLVVALAAQRLVTRPATDKHSYGLQRAEVLGALSNGVLLLAATAWITYEAVLRFGEPGHIDGTGVTVLGAIGLVVNLVSAIAVARVAGSSLNLRGAWLHLASDAAGSVLAMASGVAVLVWDATLVDPIVSLLLAVLVGILAWRLVRDAAHVLLEGAPGGVTTDAIRELLCNEPGVTDVHHIHLWSLTSEASAMSAHVVLSDEPTLHEAQAIGQRLRAILEDRLDVGHATLELECHACGDADPDHRSGGVS